jgi:anti-sigma B factor antagonist
MGDMLEPTFRVEREETAAEVVINLIGEMDLGTVDEARRPMMAAIGGDDTRALIIDMSELRFIDSTGIRLLLEAQAASRADSNRLRFRGIRPEVAQTLRVTRVDDQLAIAD